MALKLLFERLAFPVDMITGKLGLCWEGSIPDCVFPGLLLPLFLAVLAIAWYVGVGKNGAGGRLPPGPRGLPLLGSLPFIDPLLQRYFVRLARTYGPIVSVRMGTKLCIAVNSVPLAKEVLKDQDAILAHHLQTGRLRAIRKGAQGLGWVNYSSHWRIFRKLAVSEVLSSSKLDTFKRLRREAIRHTVRQLYGNVGAPVNMGQLSLSTMLNVVTGMLWGGTFGENETERRRGAEELRPVVREVLDVFEFFPILPRFDLLGLELIRSRMLLRWERAIFFDLPMLHFWLFVAG